jgi:hypothetical protein
MFVKLCLWILLNVTKDVPEVPFVVLHIYNVRLVSVKSVKVPLCCVRCVRIGDRKLDIISIAE